MSQALRNCRRVDYGQRMDGGRGDVVLNELNFMNFYIFDLPTR
jgi:hypothetical protein